MTYSYPATIYGYPPAGYATNTIPSNRITTQSYYYNAEANSSPSGDPRATLIVHMPAGAQLTIQGQATESTGSDTRRFVSPPLEVGRTYTYSLRGDMDRGGLKANTSKQVDVRPGQIAEVYLEFPGENRDNPERLNPPDADKLRINTPLLPDEDRTPRSGGQNRPPAGNPPPPDKDKLRP
jgi:uncharacterized protein (TIGR03000 family)